MSYKKSLENFNVTGDIPAKALSTLLRVSSALAASLDLPVVLQTAIDSACTVLELESGAIYELIDGSLYLGATTPMLVPELEFLRTHPEPLKDHLHIEEALKTGQPVYVNDLTTEPLTPQEQVIRDIRRLRSCLYIPLLLEDKAIGVMIVSTIGEPRTFTEAEVDLCRVLSYQVTLAVANARLFRSVQVKNVELTHAYDATLLGWSLALEMRDQETQGHTKRVTQLALDLARAMGMQEEALPHIRRGALLHDIGKMSIPDAILKKTGPLTDTEWTVMRLHPQYAYTFLSQIDFLSPALDIPYCHHERWDGCGYPRGLKGEQIPLSARIFAVVDVFDALTTDRPYRKAWTREAALAYIREQAGKQFDPCAAANFLELVGE